MLNKKQLSITYEKWSSVDYFENSYTSIDLEKLRDLVFSMKYDETSVLYLETNELMFDIAVGKGLYSVHCLLKEEGKNFQLLGDTSDFTTIDYILGGQLYERYPSKFIVPVDEAWKYAEMIFADSRIVFEDGNWELQ